MEKSETIAKLSLALSKLQGEVHDAYKGNQGYGYKYADLSAVLEIVRPLLTKHELAVIQQPSNADDKVTVETMLCHSSGEWISEKMSMPIQVGKGMTQAQAIGSVITYCRRYALAAVAGVAQTDDDAAIQPSETKPEKKKQELKQPEIKQTMINAFIQLANANDSSAMKEAWHELSRPEQEALWKKLSSKEQAAIKDLLNKEAA